MAVKAIQLIQIGTAMGSEEKARETIRLMKEAGYDGIELNGFMIEKMDTEDLSIDIPKGKVFVMGDNRNHSLDSRKLGYFDFKDDVIGKVFFKIPF